MIFDHRELVDRQKFIVLRVVKIDQPDLVSFGFAVANTKFDVNAIGEQAVKGFVVIKQGEGIGAQDLFVRLFTGRGGDGGVEAVNGGAQAGSKDRFAVVALFGRPFSQVGAVADGVAVVGAQYVEGNLFDFRFVHNHRLTLDLLDYRIHTIACLVIVIDYTHCLNRNLLDCKIRLISCLVITSGHAHL